ncbi:triphosphoribosyl-dephospho-CoA synthase [Candidatus Methylomirabilis sp.]|uniref:Triphosphoribosyl-dephospho-CoA synthase n=1 Tax=Candidatus Methylomirabilis tolerans TaxID=3123416 RepID=A0AAJ1EJM3_9BACT|nr:triphosphoribosyl-dephospho-CoA synthase [Candidatus Methylomirabilis sp.]
MRAHPLHPTPYTLHPVQVSLAAQLACLLEVSADKPGNVTPFADFADTRYTDFLVSSVIMGLVLRKVETLATGSLVLNAVRETKRLVGRNTNLGIALLFAPLAKAAIRKGRRPLRSRLRSVLTALTPYDGQRVYEAIRLAAPGGLGDADQFDVRERRNGVPLLEAMCLAMDRDSIAREYVTDFEITFTVGAPSLERFLRESKDPRPAVIQTYLTLLSRIPDSLIARKCGAREADRISREAGKILAIGGAFTQEGRRRLQQWDRALRRDGNRLNPGTTADLTASALFVVMLEYGVEFVIRTPLAPLS